LAVWFEAGQDAETALYLGKHLGALGVGEDQVPGGVADQRPAELPADQVPEPPVPVPGVVEQHLRTPGPGEHAPHDYRLGDSIVTATSVRWPPPMPGSRSTRPGPLDHLVDCVDVCNDQGKVALGTRVWEAFTDLRPRWASVRRC